MEQNYEQLLKSNQKSNSDTKEIEAALRDSEQSQKVFLQRLFPDLKTSIKAKKHNEWLEEFATQAKAVALVANKKSVEDEGKLQKLDGQVKHYKSVLAETEKMLNQLQASVESEECRWKAKLSDKELQLENFQRQLEAMEAKNATMEASLDSLNSVEEMEAKLRELQEKLAVEEADKLQLQNQLDQSLESEEVTRLREEIHVEIQLRQELDEKVARMNQLLSTGQEALQQEKKTVEMLKQQLLSINPAKGTSVATNGQEEASVAE